MAKKTTSDNDISRVCLYHGADDGKKRTAVSQLMAELIEPDFVDFDREELYGPDTTADKVLLAASQAPFASKRRVVMVAQANDMSNSEQQALAGKLDRIPDTACVVLVTPSPQMQDGKPKRGSEIHADLMKAVKKQGKVFDFPFMRADSATQFVQETIKQAGKTISSSAAALLVRRSGTDSTVLSTEIEKLMCYVGKKGTINDGDVQQITIQTVEEKIFSLMDAVGQKKPEEAVQHLRPLLHTGSELQGDALRTLIMLARHFRQLWQVRILIDAGIRQVIPGRVPSDVEALLPQDGSVLKMEDWKRNKLFAQAKNFSLSELRRSFEKIAAVDLSMKGIEGKISDPMMAMEVLVIELSSRPESKKGRA